MTNFTAAVDRYLDEHTDDLLALVTELVCIDSQIPPWGDERLIVARLDDILAEMGVLDRQIVEPVRQVGPAGRARPEGGQRRGGGRERAEEGGEPGGVERHGDGSGSESKGESERS